jgi:uncharacterized Zn-binding protein involved in type VI secretion
MQQGTIGSIGVGICPLHEFPIPYTTVIITGHPTIQVDGQSVAMINSIGAASCGHSSVALTGAIMSVADEQGLHRVGDTGTTGGPYTLVTGAPTVDTGS